MKSVEQLYKTLVNGISRFLKKPVKRKLFGYFGRSGFCSCRLSCPRRFGPSQTRIAFTGTFSTIHSLTDAFKLCSLNKISHHVISIDPIYQKFVRELSPVLEHTSQDVTEENLQARIRGVCLMAYANKKDALLLCTSNKSELAMGYGTLYGDLAGAVMVLGDVYKTQVYELADFLNRERERIPAHTMTKEPSAELRIDQKDSDSLPPYPILDPILKAFIEEKRASKEIITAGFPLDIVTKICEQLGMSSFKYLQTPPVLAVTEHPLLPKNKCYRYST